MRFGGRVLFVTGAGSGIGAATARMFSAEGGRVAVVDINREQAEKVASAIDGSVALGVDVANEHAVQSAIERTAQEFGRLDFVVNSGGHWESRPLEEWTFEQYKRMVDVHFGGTFLVTKRR